MRNPLPLRIIPVLLLKRQGLVKGVNFRNHRYIGDPINAVSIFNELEAHELVFLDTEATSQKRIPSFKLVSDIADQCLMPFAVGGGINNIAQIRKLLAAGAEKVIINSGCLKNPELISQAANVFGRQSITIGVDVAKIDGRYSVLSHNASANTGLSPIAWARKVASLGAGEIIVTSIEREGTMKGYDTKLTKMIASSVQVPVVASGGAGRLDDFNKAISSGASAVAAGSMFVYYGRRRAVLINYPNTAEIKKITTCKNLK